MKRYLYLHRSGTVTGTVANVAFTKPWPTNTTAATFNAFALFVPAQGADEPNLEFDAWFDTVQYKVYGLIGLTAQRVGANQLVLSWTTDGYTLQYNDSSIANAAGWAILSRPGCSWAGLTIRPIRLVRARGSSD